MPTLTLRELEVVRLMARGMCNKEIARELEISEYTVKEHCKGIFGKVDSHCRTDVAVRYVKGEFDIPLESGIDTAQE